MKKDIVEEINVPEEIEFSVDGDMVKVKGPEGELEKKMALYGIKISREKEKIKVEAKNATMREKKMIKTIVSHIKNMIKGVEEGFEYELKVCYGHFPITVEHSGNEIIVKNFLGEKIPRKSIVPEGAEVSINKDKITVKAIDKELAGQAAANIEKTTRVRGKDRRVFQDGIYIINKAGREI